MKTIELTVAPNGKSKLETKGFSGSECVEASRFIEKALGQQEVELLKSEFYTQTPQQNSASNSSTQ